MFMSILYTPRRPAALAVSVLIPSPKEIEALGSQTYVTPVCPVNTVACSADRLPGVYVYYKGVVCVHKPWTLTNNTGMVGV